MNSKSRSLSGAVLMLLIIPIFAGLLACMPVPIGDPERSKIDPELTGVWAALSTDDVISEVGFYLFEPYDKRTWLVTGAGLVEGDNPDLPELDMSTYNGWVELAAADPVVEGYVSIENIGVYKAWLKKLGGEVFMTWEPKMFLDDGIPEPDTWITYHIMIKNHDRIELRYVNGESDLFDDVDETRRAYERVISKNANNPELYPEEGGADVVLVRVQETELRMIEELLDILVGWD